MRLFRVQRGLAQLERSIEEAEKYRTAAEEARVALASAEARLQECQAAREALQAKLDEKDELILVMKREGWEPSAVPMSVVDKAEERLPAKVLLAVEGVAAPGSALQLQLLREAEAQLDAGISPDEIAAEIEAGSELNPYFL